MAISLGNFFTSGDKTVLGGVGGSGLDTETLINGLVEARSFSKVRLEDKVEVNDSKLTAYAEFRTLLNTFQDASNFLRTPPGVGNASDDVFQYRTATLSSNTSIAASSYLSVAVEPGASVQGYTISDITSIARAKKQTTGTFSVADANTSVTTLAETAGSFKAGTITINGAAITLADGDSLNTVIAKFNEVKADTGIEANLLSIATGEFAIIFSATSTGTDSDFDLGDAGTVTDPDGVLNGIINATELATNGTFDTDIVGWTDASTGTGAIAYGTNNLVLNGNGVSDRAYAQQAITTEIGKSYTISADLTGIVSPAYVRVGTDADVSLGANFDLANFEVAADGSATFSFTATSTTSYLTFNSTNNTTPITVDNVSVTDDSDSAITTAQAASDAVFKIDGVDITRSRNTVPDLVEDITFTILGETPALTEIGVDVETDVDLPISGVINFINSYNDLRVFISEQTEVNEDGEFSEDAVLASDPVLRAILTSVNSELNSIVGGTASTDYDSLAEIGITFTDLPQSDDNPFVRNILTFDEAQLETALATNFEAVTELFGFGFSADNANLVAFSRTNDLNANSFSVNIVTGTNTFQATIGTDTVDLDVVELSGGAGYTLTGPEGSAIEGLVLIYASTDDATINVSVSQGIADRIYNSLDAVLDEQDGSLELAIDSTEGSTTRLEVEIERIDEQIERFRQSLIEKFAALESVISNVNTLLESLDANAAARQNN